MAFEFSTNCSDSLVVSTSGLPPGITINEGFDECCVDVQGNPSENASGTYVYSITVSNSASSYTVTGTMW